MVRRKEPFTWMRLMQGLMTLLAVSVLCCGSAFANQGNWAEMRVVAGLDEPLVATGSTSNAEDAALSAAVATFQQGGGEFAQRAKPLVAFVDAHPASAWQMALQTNLALGYYREGYFSKAAIAWRRGWEAGRDATEPRAKALADRALGELARMYARVGDADALERLFAELGQREVSGPATELVTGAREGLWMFRNDWGSAYLCGPKALRNLLETLKADPERIAVVDAARSGPRGFTFAQVAKLANEAGLDHKLIFRTADQPIPVPSVVNWKMSHYAAIIGERDGQYHIQDPTFGGDLWVSRAAIDEESSGYFLVPDHAATGAAWRAATASEAQQVYGMGNTSQNQPGATSPCDQQTSPGSGANVGMCAANAMSMVVSLNLSDTPVGYSPQKGPSAAMRLVYNQREAYQPAVFSFSNVSPKWTLSVLSWIQDNPNSAGQSVLRYAAGGGAVDYTSGYTYSTTTGAFTPDRQGQAVLVRIPATGAVTSYEWRKPDGSKLIYGLRDGATTTPRRVFLTRIVDPAGNALLLNYDAQLRLTSVTDATGRNTTFSYQHPTSTLLITRITDPFGRFASLTYDPSGRLSAITDVIGITSSFTYDAGGLVNAMTTPYGTSTFVYGQGSGNYRFLNITDAMGFTERAEFRHTAPSIQTADPVSPIGYNNIYLQYRNTFYWDKHVYPSANTDYTKARITHWLHNAADQTSPIVESVKMPLERRVWNRYAGQSNTYREGTNGLPIQIARVLDDAAVQSHAVTYNAQGKPLTSTDPVGRKTVFTYDAAGIDLLKVEQQTTAVGALSAIATFTYNSQHLPLTYADAAGQITTYTYNAAGQILTVTNALNQTTSFGYDGFGRLVTTTNANGAVQQSRTYDAFDRVATEADSEGYTLNYAYDALDRVAEITYPDGTTTKYTYDRLDLASVTDRQGRKTSYAYDANRRLTSITDPLNLVTSYGYYRNGVLEKITDPKGNVTRWDIDIQSRPVAKHYANGNVETYTYEASTSRPRTIVDPLGQVKAFAYTQDDRVKGLTYTSTVQPTPNVAFTFDTFFPRPVTMTDGLGVTTFQYHPIGAPGALKLASDDGPFNNDRVAYTYDQIGRVATRTVDAAVETFSYDSISRTIGHVSPLGAFTRTYLGQTGQLTSQVATNGVGTAWSYEPNLGDRRLKAITNAGQARSFSFTTTPESQITAITESVGGMPLRTWQYGYDALDRLQSAQPSNGMPYSYAYDAADNLTSNNGVSIAHNAANQVTSLAGDPHVYDAAGNLLNDGTRTYKWDAESRLIGIQASTKFATTLRYDGMGRRLVLADTAGATTTETRHLWCGETLCQARNASDQVTRRYYTQGVVYPQTGQQLYYGIDQLGSVRDIVSMQTGGKIGGFDYEPYGGQLGKFSNPNATTDFRYAGLYFHSQSGLYLANYRAYNPRTAQWLSRDPIAEEGGFNLYGYVSGSPITKLDPTGEITPIDSAIGGVTSVMFGKALAWATGEEYSWCQAAYDFAEGALTSGLSNVNKIRKLGRALDKAADAAAAEAKVVRAGKGAANPKVAAAAARGRQVHKDWDYGKGFEKEFTLPSGKRPDAVNLQTRTVVELKPNNPQAIRRGEKQLEGYVKELQDTYGGNWTGKIQTYD